MSTTLSKRYAHCWDECYKGFDEQGLFYRVRYYFDDWADSDQILAELIGTQTYDGTSVVRNVPHQHPLNPYLYCRSAEIVGSGPPALNTNGYPSYTGGFFVSAVYRPAIWSGSFSTSPQELYQQIDPATPVLWCTQELDFDTEIYTVPNHSYKFASDNKLAGIPVKLTLGITTMRLTFHSLPYLPATQLRAARGRVNTTTFLGAGAGFVLFRGGQTRRESASDGSTVQQVTLILQERDVEWNKVPRKDSLTWDTLTDGSGNNMFKTYDLNKLLFS